MGDKKGSHVGLIASFAIFILFLTGIYFVIQPVFKTQQDKQSLLTYLQVKLTDEFSANLTTIIISSYGTCLKINNTEADVQSPVYAIVKDKNGTLVDSQFSGQDLIIASSSSNVLWVYYSEVPFITPVGPSSCSNWANVNSIRKNKHLFERRILEKSSNYTNLTSKVNIPKGSEFGLTFELNNGTLIKINEKEVSGNVYVKEIPIHYVDERANILSGKLILKIW